MRQAGQVTSATSRPPLDPARLAVPGWSVEILPETPSTNAVLSARARAGAPAGSVVTTEHQIAGRGRLDRGWTMPPRAALAVSALLRPDGVPAERWPWLPLMTGVAVAGTLRDLGYAAGLKWPNDVLIDGRKVCGILVERVETPTGPAAVVGVGLNTSLAADELPVPTATSLEIESGTPVDRTEVLAALLGRLTAAYDSWLASPDRLEADYRALSVTVGEQVRAELPDGSVLAGRATAIDRHGRLVIAHDGKETPVGAGDVVHARLV